MSHLAPKSPRNAQIWPKMPLGEDFFHQLGVRQGKPGKAHFIGIGGIGVSALARYFQSQGWEVSGSNLAHAPENTPLLRELSREGIKIKVGYNKRNVPTDANLVIHTQAETISNPEIAEAKRRRMKILTYPQTLGKLTKHFETIAIAGTHGKSTATALTALALIKGHFDPTVFIGTKVPQFKNRNFRQGRSKHLVLEADEYKNAFLNYYPKAALITNIDREHLDYFKNLNQTKQSFLRFISNLRLSDSRSGVLVLNKDSAPLLSMRNQPSLKLRHGKVIWYSLKEKKIARKIKKHLKIPGEHNVSNALGVYKLARALNIKEKDILAALSKYRGAYRRMEYRGQFKIPRTRTSSVRDKIDVYDDYAHHPTEIKATLSAFREKYPKSKIICVFQPHQMERLKKLFEEFTAAFDQADTLILLDIFKVRGRERAGSRRKEIGSKQLREAIQKKKKSPETIYLHSPTHLKQVLSRLAKNRSVIVMMGAGNIVDITPRLLK